MAVSPFDDEASTYGTPKAREWRARGLSQSEMAESVHRSTIEELTDWTLWADKVIVY